MSSKCLRSVLAVLTALCWLAGHNESIAAIQNRTEPAHSAFQVLPADGPAERQRPRALAFPRPIIIVKSEGVSDIIRQGFLRAVFFSSLGVIGMIFIGWRYGRRQGNSAR